MPQAEGRGNVWVERAVYIWELQVFCGRAQGRVTGSGQSQRGGWRVAVAGTGALSTHGIH